MPDPAESTVVRRPSARFWRVGILLAVLSALTGVVAYAVRHRSAVPPQTIPSPTIAQPGQPFSPNSRRRVSSVAEALSAYETTARNQLEPACRANGIAYPPNRLLMLAFKQERRLEVWAANRSGKYARIATYPILGASGSLGPKRAQGDLQVPEGLYRLTDLNPKSVAHLSFRVDYPNAEDRAHAIVPPSRLGGDIFVHGHTVSYGCLAMGDPTIETLFCLVARVPAANRRILLCPVDFRQNPAYADAPREEAWIRDLYQRERKMLTNFPLTETP